MKIIEEKRIIQRLQGQVSALFEAVVLFTNATALISKNV